MGATVATWNKLEDIKPRSEVSTGAVTKSADKAMDQFESGRIVWFLVRRHKFGLMTAWAVALTILYFFPVVPTLLLSYLHQL